MPWDAAGFHKHNLKLSGDQSAHGARIANAVLDRTGSERTALAVANKYFEKHDDGGTIGGLQPSDQTANPLVQGMIQRYASMPAEKLQELSAMMGGTPQGQIVQRVLAQKRAMPQNAGQADLTQAPQQAKRGGPIKKRDFGGGLGLSQGDPYWARGEERSSTGGAGAVGYLHGTTSGRADQILTTAPAGAYVVPADVVSGLGEGNSLAGAGVIQKMLATGPHGIPMPRAGGRSSMPRPPPAYREPNSKGGKVAGDHEQTPVALSHGEMVIPPEHVAHWGGGDIKAGHKWWDNWVIEQRKKIIATMKKLPPPVGSSKKS